MIRRHESLETYDHGVNLEKCSEESKENIDQIQDIELPKLFQRSDKELQKTQTQPLNSYRQSINSTIESQGRLFPPL